MLGSRAHVLDLARMRREGLAKLPGAMEREGTSAARACS